MLLRVRPDFPSTYLIIGELMSEVTHEGAPAATITPEQQLQRTVMACMLYEGNFYEQGEFVADRIARLVRTVSPAFASEVALKAKTDGLKTAPLCVVAAMATASPEHRRLVRGLVPIVASRPDFAVKMLSYYDHIVGGAPAKITLANGLKKGLAAALCEFDDYQLAKYQSRTEKVMGTEHEIGLKSLARLVHPAAPNQETWGKLLAGTLPPPTTWEA
jgi:60 kDa SS-A/Ro ribonucleoprotein